MKIFVLWTLDFDVIANALFFPRTSRLIALDSGPSAVAERRSRTRSKSARIRDTPAGFHEKRKAEGPTNLAPRRFASRARGARMKTRERWRWIPPGRGALFRRMT